jgi:hypothetical protein
MAAKRGNFATCLVEDAYRHIPSSQSTSASTLKSGADQLLTRCWSLYQRFITPDDDGISTNEIGKTGQRYESF